MTYSLVEIPLNAVFDTVLVTNDFKYTDPFDHMDFLSSDALQHDES